MSIEQQQHDEERRRREEEAAAIYADLMIRRDKVRPKWERESGGCIEERIYQGRAS